MQKGKIIVIEGSCDGVGKSTQYQLLYKRLLEEKKKVLSHHFSTYNSYQGIPVEEYLKGTMGDLNNLSPYFINSLYALDRGVTWYTGLKEQYENGATILFDRYTTSSLIYQSALIEDRISRQKFWDYVSDYEYKKLGIQEPDCVLFLHIPFELSQRLRAQRKEYEGLKNDLHEKNIDYLYKVYQSSLEVAEYFQWNMIECSENNRMRKPEEIHEQIYALIKK